MKKKSLWLYVFFLYILVFFISCSEYQIWKEGVGMIVIWMACVTTSSLDTGGEEVQDTAEEINPITLLDSSQLPAAPSPCREPVLVDVNFVVDGDTIFVQGPEGEEKVRLIGVNSAEIGYDGDPDECYAEEARDFLISLIDDEKVWLTFDETCRDVYDRRLAYIHTAVGSQGFVQRQILQRGMAPDFPFNDTPTFNSLFAEDATDAAQSGIGGWGACGWSQ
jgi:endonuclease YncB( thermonuclease family)